MTSALPGRRPPRGAALVSLLFLVAVAACGQDRGAAAEPRAVTPRGPLLRDEQATVEIFEHASPSVVYITTLQRVRDFWTRNVMRVPSGTGSGFLWDDQGHVVTNLHVLRGGQEARVSLGDQRSYAATFVGASPEHDLAVLKIDVAENPPPPLPIGTSGDLKVGQDVYAIGNPFGLDHTLTTGIISALDRSIDNDLGGVIEHLIQTDAAINPGNSGGPLIDSAGRLIGINTAIYSPSGAYAGIGFAVPVDTINEVVPQLISSGRFVHPVLGVSADDATSRRLLDPIGVEGVLVLRVVDGSPAERAGIRPTLATFGGSVVLGDVIQSIDGARVRTFEDLTDRLDEHSVGDRAMVGLWRNGESIEIEVELVGG